MPIADQCRLWTQFPLEQSEHCPSHRWSQQILFVGDVCTQKPEAQLLLSVQGAPFTCIADANTSRSLAMIATASGSGDAQAPFPATTKARQINIHKMARCADIAAGTNGFFFFVSFVRLRRNEFGSKELSRINIRNQSLINL